MTCINKTNGVGFGEFILLGCCYSVFAFLTGDFFNYEELYNLAILHGEENHFEPFYYWLIHVLPTNYYLWRAVVWGSAVIIAALIYRKTSPNFRQCSFLFCLMVLPTFPNLRNNLGLVVLYYSVIIFLFSQRNFKTRIILLILGIICAYQLHKSMFMYIVIFGIAMLPTNKYFFIGSILGFPFIYKYVPLLSSLFLKDSFANEASMASGQGYLDAGLSQIANFYGILQVSIWRLPVLILIAYAIYHIYFKQYIISYRFRVFLNYSYILLYMACLFYAQPVSEFFSSRFQDAVMLPLTIFLGYYLTVIHKSKIVKISLYTLVLANLYDFSYSFYKYLL